MKKDICLYGPSGHRIEFEARGRGEQREAMRALSAMARNAYSASESNRLNANWAASNENINVVLQRELRVLRARSRQVCKNNPYASAALNTFQNFVVGVGFDLQMRVSKPVRTEDGFVRVDMDAFNDYNEDLFNDWAEDVNIAAPPLSPDSFYDVQIMMLRNLIIDGEILVHTVLDKGHDVVPLVLEFIDADNLDCAKMEHEGNPVVMGVELDKRSWQPVAYWVFSKAGQNPKYPSNINSRRIPASDMIHVFQRLEPLQVRGVPFFAPVLQALFNVGDYTNTQMIRSKLAAMLGVFLTGEGGTTMLSDKGAADDTIDGFPVDVNGNVIANLQPGMIAKLPDGVTASMMNPSAPEAASEVFVKSQLKAIGGGINFGLSYTGLTRDTQGTTFASGRQAENMDYQGFRPLMKMFGRKALSPIFRKWMDAGVLSGAVIAPSYDMDPRFWQRHEWMPGGWSRGVNPLQEINASSKSMAVGLTTHSDECSLQGHEWKTQFRQMAKEKRYAESLGLTIEGLTDEDGAETETEEDPAVAAELVQAAVLN